MDKYFPMTYTVNVERTIHKLHLDSCQRFSTFQEYCTHYLRCHSDTKTSLSTDLMMLHEVDFGPAKRVAPLDANFSYFTSEYFLKFAAFHDSTGRSLSIHRFHDSTYLIRLPALDTSSFPENNSTLSYIFPVSAVKFNSNIVPYFERFSLDKYHVSHGSSFHAAFMIVSDAIAHSLNGNILMLSCTRAITVKGCSPSTATERLRSTFPSRSSNQECPNNYTRTRVNIVSVKKLAVIAHTWYNAFYHMVAEAMSRLMIIHELLVLDPEIFVLIQRPIYSPSTEEFLNHFGIPEDRVIYLEPERNIPTLYEAKIMFIPRGISCGGPPPSLLEQIHNKGIEGIKRRTFSLFPYRSIPLPFVHASQKIADVKKFLAPPVKTGPIIFVSRPAARRRALVNEQEILKFLSISYPDIPVVLFYGNLSQKNTIELFHSACVLIAPHGAGQVHVLWMRPGTAMLEVSSKVDYNGLYETIAMYRQVHTYVYFDQNATRATSIRVEMTQFKQLFENLMKDRY